MLAKYDVDAILREVIAERIDKESLDVHHLVRDLPKEPLFVVFRDLRYSGVGARILLRQVVALLRPEGLQLPDYLLLVVDKCDALLRNLLGKNLLNVET